MKVILVFAVGVGLGAFSMHYRDNAQFAAKANMQADHAVSQIAATAHSSLSHK